MFSPMMQDLVHQEMQDEAIKLKNCIVEMEAQLQRATTQPPPSSSTLVSSYQKWDSYRDTEELQTNVTSAKTDLAKLKEKIADHTNGNSIQTKTCSHRNNCGCSGNRQAEREAIAMGTARRLQEMQSLKREGNALFGHQKHQQALALYEKSLIYFEYCFDGTDEEQKRADELRLVCLLNAAACFLHLKMYPRCIDYCNEALEIDDTNVKALFRRARAYRLHDKFDVAEEDLKRVIVLNGGKDCRDAKREIKLLNDCKERYEKKSVAFAHLALGVSKMH